MNGSFWLSSGDGRWSILVRLLLAGVFIPEGIQKLIYPDELGAGRFEGIGIPFASLTGPLVGWVELICGMLILLGLAGRMASIPLIVIMVVAIVSTKVPILLGQDWLIFQVRDLDRYGWWSMLHETRTDWAMLCGAVFILLSGPGRWSIDGMISGGAARRRL